MNSELVSYVEAGLGEFSAAEMASSSYRLLGVRAAFVIGGWIEPAAGRIEG